MSLTSLIWHQELTISYKDYSLDLQLQQEENNSTLWSEKC